MYELHMLMLCVWCMLGAARGWGGGDGGGEEEGEGGGRMGKVRR